MNSDKMVGIDRNEKTGSGKGIVLALIIAGLVFFVPQLDFQKLGEQLGISKETPTIRTKLTTPHQKERLQTNKKVHWHQKTDKGSRVERVKPAPVKPQKVQRKKPAIGLVSRSLPLLMVAVKKDNLYLVKKLIAEGTNPKIQDIDGNEALAYVTDMTSPELIDYLLAQGLDINHRNKYQNTPLMFAIKSAGVKQVKFMIERGADVRAMTRSGRTMVSMTPKADVRAYLQSLPESNIPLSLTRVWWRQASLAEVKQEFLKNQDFFKDPKVLALAAANTGDPAVIQFLLDNGHDVNRVDDTGITPIFAAASSNSHPEIIRFLVAKGADVNRQEEAYGTTPLMAAAYFQHNPALFETLLALGADVQIQDWAGMTAVEYARAYNDSDIVHLLHRAMRK